MKNRKFIGTSALLLSATLIFTGCSDIRSIMAIKNGTTQAPIEYTTTEESEADGTEESTEGSGEYATEEPITQESGESSEIHKPSVETTHGTQGDSPTESKPVGSNPTTTKPTGSKPTTSKPTTSKPTTAHTSPATEEATTPKAQTEMEAAFWSAYGDYKNYQNNAQNVAAYKACEKVVNDIMANYTTDFDREKALHDYICNTCVYDSSIAESGNTSRGRTPYSVLVENNAIHAGYAKTFEVCLNMMGIKCYTITGSASDGSSNTWNQVCLDGNWYEVDCALDDEGSIASYEYFNLTTAEMNAANHSKYKVSRKVTCNGGEYGKQYFINKATEEFHKAIAGTYFDSVGKVETYIRKNVSRGIYEMEFYMTKAVGNEVSNYDSFIRGMDLHDFYDYEVTYKAKVVSGLWEIKDTTYMKIKLIDMSFYESMDNYFTDETNCLEYLDGLAAKGTTSATVYVSKDMYEDYISKTKWKSVQVSAVGKMLTLYNYKLQYTK